jgi:hypothetical protein
LEYFSAKAVRLAISLSRFLISCEAGLKSDFLWKDTSSSSFGDLKLSFNFFASSKNESIRMLNSVERVEIEFCGTELKTGEGKEGL